MHIEITLSARRPPSGVVVATDAQDARSPVDHRPFSGWLDLLRILSEKIEPDGTESR